MDRTFNSCSFRIQVPSDCLSIAGRLCTFSDQKLLLLLSHKEMLQLGQPTIGYLVKDSLVMFSTKRPNIWEKNGLVKKNTLRVITICIQHHMGNIWQKLMGNNGFNDQRYGKKTVVTRQLAGELLSACISEDKEMAPRHSKPCSKKYAMGTLKPWGNCRNPKSLEILRAII